MASGYYHIYNALKYRILHIMYQRKVPLTAQQIADYLGIDRQRVSDTLYRWIKRKYKYVRRLENKANGGNGKAFRYKINKYGIEALKMYSKRLKAGLDMNCKKELRVPQQVDTYIRMNAHGKLVGMTKDEMYAKAGFN